MQFSRLVLLGIITKAAAPSPSNEELALAADGECAAGTDDCALNALQMRIAKSTVLDDTHPIVKLELFKPMRHKELEEEFTNTDMFSITGVLHWLHTKAVWEHYQDWSGMDLKEPRMKKRGEDVDVIAGINARVRNPNSVIDEVGIKTNFVDFAALAQFVDGMATGPKYNWDYGDIVGVEDIRDRGFITLDPFYQFSLSGYCPNLDWAHKHGKHSKKTGVCMKYSDHYDLPEGKTLKGGLCPGGTKPGVDPQGKAGCVYTYTPPTKANVTKLDDLVGITKEDCGGHNCKNWEDFRRHCTNRKYRRKFNYVEANSAHSHHRRRGGRRRSLLETGEESDLEGKTIIKTSYCVEYDIHKACAKNCHSKKCRKIPAHLREVGLPFWQGRCDPLRNAQRAEILAVELGITEARTNHRLIKKVETETCVDPDPKSLCHPNPEEGGMYCSREWGGVCQPCLIPGTVKPYPGKDTALCPWDILRTGSDYTNPSFHPKCASDKPSDFCCLYTNSCNPELLNEVNATEDGFAYTMSLQDTAAMEAFVIKAANQSLGKDVSEINWLRAMSYWKWSFHPYVGRGFTLEATLRQIESRLR